MKRSIVLVLMALFVLAPLSSAQENQDAVKPEVTAKATDAYTCPMHPDVKSDKAAACPKCGMDLQKNTTAAGTKACCEGKSAECQKKCAEMKASGAKGDGHGCCGGKAKSARAPKASPRKMGTK